MSAEPRGEPGVAGSSLGFVIHKHAATRLHYDFRLEIDGVMVSWAVPKGPSCDPTDKRLAVHVEDHPIAYNTFEGTIPKGQYGAGTVIIWDRGTWEPIDDPAKGMRAGKLVFQLHGHKLGGLWELVRTSRGGERQEKWLLFKKRDTFARSSIEYDVLSALPDSVVEKPLTAPEPHSTSSAMTPLGSPTRGSRKHAGAKPGIPGATRAPLPEKLAPQLATLARTVPTTGKWVYEIKFDGYRILTRVDKGSVTLTTRNGHNWTDKMPGLAKEIQQLGLSSGWLDGEIVVLDDEGLPSFHALQTAFEANRSADIRYFLFDVPFLNGFDLRRVTLQNRRAVLRSLIDDKGTDHVRFSDDFDATPATILTSACHMNLEGVVAKRADAPYVSSRSETWLKLKCTRRQEFVVCGYTDRSDGSPQIGSLLLGVYDDAGSLVPVGSVGTGWGANEARTLKAMLRPLEMPAPAFGEALTRKGQWSRRGTGRQRWVKPTLVAEVSFAQWTADGQLRHASYLGLRTDKEPRSIVREDTQALDTPAAGRMRAATAAHKGLLVTHGERVIDTHTGLTKLQLVRYYASVAEWILPHLKGRPVSLVRGPTGVGGQLFFQKHGMTAVPGIKELDPALWPGHDALLEISSAKALSSAAQMNVIEFHTWNATTPRLERPDRMIFDLDPGEGVAWSRVQEAAELVHGLLTELGLEAWLKTSGGKGLHVVVPLARRYTHDRVKNFSRAIVQHLTKTIPSRFVAKSGPSNRIGKIFVDYLRNGVGATTVAAFSARARPGLGVSMPVGWDALNTLTSGAHWTITDARDHLSLRRADPWEKFWTTRQGLADAMKVLGFT